jgi:solute:Na+ symporter, SSS family
MSDRQFLITLRVVLLAFTAGALVFAINSKKTMYDMIQNAYTVTLVSAFVPLAAGIFWKRANNAGAMLSAVLGFMAWLVADMLSSDATVVPAPLVGLAFSIVGMVIGAFLPRAAAVPAAHRHGER